jgi:hypothetical protein
MGVSLQVVRNGAKVPTHRSARERRGKDRLRLAPTVPELRHNGLNIATRCAVYARLRMLRQTALGKIVFRG